MQCLIATAYHIAVRLPSSALPNKTEGFSRRRASRLELLNGRTKTSASQLDELRNRKARECINLQYWIHAAEVWVSREDRME
jgi:hypothetical protein